MEFGIGGAESVWHYICEMEFYFNQNYFFDPFNRVEMMLFPSATANGILKNLHKFHLLPEVHFKLFWRPMHWIGAETKNMQALRMTSRFLSLTSSIPCRFLAELLSRVRKISMMLSTGCATRETTTRRMFPPEIFCKIDAPEQRARMIESALDLMWNINVSPGGTAPCPNISAALLNKDPKTLDDLPSFSTLRFHYK